MKAKKVNDGRRIRTSIGNQDDFLFLSPQLLLVLIRLAFRRKVSDQNFNTIDEFPFDFLSNFVNRLP